MKWFPFRELGEGPPWLQTKLRSHWGNQKEDWWSRFSLSWSICAKTKKLHTAKAIFRSRCKACVCVNVCEQRCLCKHVSLRWSACVYKRLPFCISQYTEDICVCTSANICLSLLPLYAFVCAYMWKIRCVYKLCHLNCLSRNQNWLCVCVCDCMTVPICICESYDVLRLPMR